LIGKSDVRGVPLIGFIEDEGRVAIENSGDDLKWIV
jgi:hypothetical protein